MDIKVNDLTALSSKVVFLTLTFDGNARKLTMSDATDIRKAYASGESSAMLAHKYSVHQDSIQNIVANRTYKEETI